ncbi:MAG: CoA transferase [Ilumatobacteraceae bacterium]
MTTTGADDLTTPQHGTGPLAAQRVLDLSSSIPGAYCAKLLGDLGADVVKIEPPGGDPLRWRGPFRDGTDPEAGTSHLYFNTSKRSVVLDLDAPEGLGLLRRLVQRYDVVVADGTAEQLARRGIDPARIRSWNPAAVVCTLSPFGSSGPSAEYSATHLTTCASSTWASTCGTADREPLQSGSSLTETIAGAYAAAAVLAAIEGRAAHGHGEHVDVSALEAAITCAMGPTLTYELRGTVDGRHSDYMTGPSFNVRCRGGLVGANALTEAQWQSMCLFIGRPDMADDPRFADYFGRLEHIDEIRSGIEAALADRSAADVFAEAQAWRIPFGLVVSPAEALALPVHADRQYFDVHAHPTLGPLRTPRIPFVMSATNARTRPAPLLGADTDDVLALLPAERVVPPAPAAPAAAPGAPLAGLRILDLTMFMSGPLATLIAADMGADVIKIEAIQRLDGWRGVGRDGERPWDRSGLFNWINRNKRGITLNLADERGASALRELVAVADVVIENYTPRVMENFGLTYDDLRAVNPKLIMLSMPGFGQTGRWRDHAAFAWTTEQMSTITHLTGYADGPPLFTGTTCGDPLAGLMGAIALLAAVNHRRRTGEGQHVDLSQVEASTSFVGESLVEAQVTGRDPGRLGNASTWMAPHGVYEGADGRWLAIACVDDEMWSRLWDALGRPGGSADGGPPHPTLAQRLANVAEIDGWVRAFVAGHDPRQLVHALQGCGIAAGAVLDGPDLLADAHLAARGFFIVQDRTDLQGAHYFAEPFRLATAQLPEPVRAAYLGEHNHEVLCGLLGKSEQELAQLEHDGVIGTWPAGVPRPSEPARD